MTTLLTLMALLAAVLRALGMISGRWDPTGVLSASAAAGVAWQEVRRHRPLTYAHKLVEQDLDTLRVAMSTTVREDAREVGVVDDVGRAAEAARRSAVPDGDQAVGVVDDVAAGREVRLLVGALAPQFHALAAALEEPAIGGPNLVVAEVGLVVHAGDHSGQPHTALQGDLREELVGVGGGSC
ncbi:hypothetical protein PV740_46850 [Streptomyces europaeiscabiei]|nr:hypothetical protein [Streptomyces europaeiscabiei]MDX3589076.1 hypothetical protein [Streptomyces europaeiscabiei]